MNYSFNLKIKKKKEWAGEVGTNIIGKLTAGSLFVLGFGARCYYRTGLSVSTSDDGIPNNRH